MPNRICQRAGVAPPPPTISKAKRSARHDRVGVRLEQIGGRHESIADGLDLLQSRDAPAMLFQVEGQTVEIRDHLFGRMALAIAGEADQIAEDDRHVLEAPR